MNKNVKKNALFASPYIIWIAATPGICSGFLGQTPRNVSLCWNMMWQTLGIPEILRRLGMISTRAAAGLWRNLDAEPGNVGSAAVRAAPVCL